MVGVPMRTYSRRSTLEGIGFGALGLAGAALLGCGPAKDGAGSSAASTDVRGAVSGAGLPKTAPVVPGKIRDGGTWTTALTTTTKPHDAHTVTGQSIWNRISERALEPDPNNAKILPHVLTSWEVADPSGLSLVFKVHPKLLVHDMPPWNGRQFTAEDVAWNIERIGGLYADRLKIAPALFQRASMVANLVKAEAVDPLTVKVTLSKRNSAFFNGLMENRTCLMPKEMDDVGLKDPLKMAGIGAFQVTDWVVDQKTAFKKNPQYAQFRPGEPHFAEWKEIVVPDTAAQQAAFISGQAQVVTVASPNDISFISKGKPSANLYASVDGQWSYLRPSAQVVPFQDARVRKAVQLAIDYFALNDGYWGPGWAYMAMLNPGFPEAWQPEKIKTLPGYNPDTKAADRAEAVKLMTAAGYPAGKGIDFSITTDSGSPLKVWNTTVFQAQMATVFPEMKMTFDSKDNLAWSAATAEGRFQMTAGTITCVTDAVLEFITMYHSKGSRNYGGGNIPPLDALTDKGIAELDRNARGKILEDLQRGFVEDWVPAFHIGASPKQFMLQGDIGGYDKVIGPWFQYSSTGQTGRWYYVDK